MLGSPLYPKGQEQNGFPVPNLPPAIFPVLYTLHIALVPLHVIASHGSAIQKIHMITNGLDEC